MSKCDNRDGLPNRKLRSSRAAGPKDREIGQRIKRQREQAQLSQDELGRRLGLSGQQIDKYERGGSRIPAGRLVEIASILEIPVANFFSGTPVKAVPSGRPSVAGNAAGDEVLRKICSLYRKINSAEKRQLLLKFTRLLTKS